MRLDNLINKREQGPVTREKAEQAERDMGFVMIYYDFESDSWDFGELDDWSEAEAREWISKKRLVDRYQRQSGEEISVVHGITFNSVASKEHTEMEAPDAPDFLEDYMQHTDSVREAFLCWKFEIPITETFNTR